MSVRIEIELTSSAPDGSWTWRAAGAREPRGVLTDRSCRALVRRRPAPGRDRTGRRRHPRGLRRAAEGEVGAVGLLELLPTEETFEPVVQHRAPGGAARRRAPRRGRVATAATARRPSPDHRGPPGDAVTADGPDGGGPSGAARRPAARPHFTPPPEVPQRPKPKRVRPGKQHRTECSPAARGAAARRRARAAGHGAVRQRLREDNARLKAEGKPGCRRRR